MQIKISSRPLFPVGLIFAIATAVIILLKSPLASMGVSAFVLGAGNFILFIATSLSFILFQKAIRNNNPHYVLRMVYGALGLKMVICIVAMLLYVLVMRKDVNKFAIFGCLGLYCIYTFTEIKILLGLSKQQKNA